MPRIRLQPRDTFSVNREIDSLVSQFWGDARHRDEPDGFPKVDIVESESVFVLHAELPGMSREGIGVSLEDGVLTLSGERKLEGENEAQGYVHRERRFGSFKRSFKLGKKVQADTISASYKEGVLAVTLPKAEEIKPRQIEVAVS